MVFKPVGVDENGKFPPRVESVFAGTIIEKATPQPDFVKLAQQRSPYKRMTVKRVSYSGNSNALEVNCFSDDTEHNRVAYLITGGTAYRIVAEVREHNDGYASSYAPPLTGETDADYGVYDVRVSQSEVTTSGTWNTTSTWYTTQVGATWTAQITTTEANAKVVFNVYTDNRGGKWNVDLVQAPAVTGSISTYAATAAIKYGVQVLTVPTPGTYTLRGTFAGDDPANVPSGGAGTSRGWLLGSTSTAFLARVSQPVQGYVALSPGVSNKNFAFKVQNPSAGVAEFIPYHGTQVETIVDQPIFYNGASVIDVNALALDQSVNVDSFTMVQHIKGHTSASATELVEIWTIDVISPNSTYHAEGAVKVISNLKATSAMYSGMLPFNPAVLDTVVTSYRNSYPATVAMGDGHSTNLPKDEGRYVSSVAMVGANPNQLAAVRFNDRDETRRVSDNTYSVPAFIEHRNSGLAKFYPRLGYTDGDSVSTGNVWRFNVDYWFGRAPGIKPMVTI